MDRERVQAFLDRFVAYASGTTTMGLLAVADRSGLLSWLGEHESGTLTEIAEGANLQPRYVKEILYGLTAAGAIEYEPDLESFRLPPEHALLLASEESPYFMGGWLDMLPPILGQIDQIVDATRNGGGVGFEEFGPGLVQGIDRGNSPSQRVFLTTRWLPAVPDLPDLLDRGARIADVGCGSGTAAILMAEAFPHSTVTGFDVSAAFLELAESRSGDIDNVRFEESSADAIPVDPPYDLVTAFDVIHDLLDPLAALVRIRESLAPGGRFLMMEPNMSSRLEDNLNDRGAMTYGISALHCMTQSLARGGAGLGAAWGREMAEEYAAKAGFTSFRELEAITNKFSAFYVLSG